MIKLIIAKSLNNVIGKDNKLLWKQSADLRRFKSLTENSVVVMGRKTFESIGKPLPNRRNIIISRSGLKFQGVETMTYEEVIKISKENDINVIGGGEIYNLFLPFSDVILMTLIQTNIEGDTYFPILDGSWKKISESFHKKDEKNEYDYAFIEYRK